MEDVLINPDSKAAEPNADQMKLYASLAQAKLDEQIDLTRQAAESNAQIASKIGLLDAVSANAAYACRAQVAIASAFIHNWIYTNPTLDFDNGKRLKFEGESWGIGLGGGVVWMIGATSLPPEQLIGEVSYQFSATIGLTELNWWKDGTPIGLIAGGGLNVSVGHFAGTGKFSWA